ncbi:MAG TPA: hypothetical protein VKR32_00065 [Puia sp.]|nr:hypothetical protein [Puia sp.]
MNVKIDSLDKALKLRQGDVIFQQNQLMFRIRDINVSSGFVTVIQIGTPDSPHLSFFPLGDLISEDWYQFHAVERDL